MKLHYYPGTDSLNAEFKGGPGVETRNVAGGLNDKLGAGSDVVGFDIDHVTWRLNLATLDPEPLTPTRPGVGLLSAAHTWIAGTP